MAEEQRCREGHRLCANNCGFFGSPATMNFCSKCYADCRLKEEQASSAKAAVEKSLQISPRSPPASSPFTVSANVPCTAPVEQPYSSSSAAEQPPAVPPGRCSNCRKKVGLTGFKCRCGAIFCGMHRYPEQHHCTFDFKALGRDAIAKANPLIKAAKLNKI